MKRTLGTGALLVLLAMSTACSFKIFEDIGSDPHPPSVEITGLFLFVEPETPVVTTTDKDTKDTASPPGRAIVWDSGGFTLGPDQKFLIARSYSDAGGDIVRFRIRDRDGSLESNLTPSDQTYYSGTSGTIIGPADGLELVGIAGPHRLELWAEDSHGSRSEKVEFVITLTF